METLNSSHELSLDFKPTFIPKTVTRFLEQVSKISGVNEKVLQVDDFINQLEIERNKIEIFKREVPLCMILINDGMFHFSFLLLFFIHMDRCSKTTLHLYVQLSDNLNVKEVSSCLI